MGYLEFEVLIGNVSGNSVWRYGMEIKFRNPQHIMILNPRKKIRSPRK